MGDRKAWSNSVGLKYAQTSRFITTKMLSRQPISPRLLRAIPSHHGRLHSLGFRPCHGTVSIRFFSNYARQLQNVIKSGDPKGPGSLVKAAQMHEATAMPPAAGKGKKQESLLSEKLVTNSEQRKADWAIIKEMSQYLWPKVL